MTPKTAIIVVAAGSGTRLGAGTPKALAAIPGSGHDETVLSRCLANIVGFSEPIQLIVVGPESHLAQVCQIAKTTCAGTPHALEVVSGGSTRQESVAAGLRVLAGAIEVVLVHDAARPNASTKLFARVRERVELDACGVVPVLPVADSLKRVSGDLVTGSIDRDQVVVAQTPQGFPAAELVAAYSGVTDTFTDDAGLFAAWGGAVMTVPGDPLAEKITFEADLNRLAFDAGGDTLRTGIGADLHEFAPAGYGVLRLAGIDWVGEPRLIGHSDGDSVLHAICDSLLSAAGLGDMGKLFGTDRPEFAGASSEVFVVQTLRLLAEAGFEPVSIAVQVIAEHPKISTQRDLAQQRLTELLGVPTSIGATTTDGLGFLGAGDGVAAVATALIRSVR